MLLAAVPLLNVLQLDTLSHTNIINSCFCVTKLGQMWVLSGLLFWSRGQPCQQYGLNLQTWYVANILYNYVTDSSILNREQHYFCITLHSKTSQIVQMANVRLCHCIITQAIIILTVPQLSVKLTDSRVYIYNVVFPRKFNMCTNLLCVLKILV